ncbi:MAG TPA: helix-turn-helix domain-containing protein [Caulobacteraceae bacterium]|jgi:hypothetical protein
MFISFDNRPSDSPYIEQVWRSRSARGGSFYSMAEPNIEFVVARVAGREQVILRGPVTQASRVHCPADGEWLGIRLRVGTHLPAVATTHLTDHRSLVLPGDGSLRFWFADRAWEIPTFETAECLVSRLAAAGLIAVEGIVQRVFEGRRSGVTERSVQRRFVQATGLTRDSLRQIERARQAALLLAGGAAALDVVFQMGFFDQAHLIRALRRWVGPTPGGLLRNEDQLSFLYNAAPLFPM